jgi:hypothetical protein
LSTGVPTTRSLSRRRFERLTAISSIRRRPSDTGVLSYTLLSSRNDGTGLSAANDRELDMSEKRLADGGGCESVFGLNDLKTCFYFKLFKAYKHFVI